MAWTDFFRKAWPELKPDAETWEAPDGWCDFTLAIGHIDKHTAGLFTLRVMSSLRGAAAGFNVRVPSVISAGLKHDEKGDIAIANVLKFHLLRDGLNSDRFVQAVAKYYGLEAPGLRMRDQVTVTAVALHDENKAVADEEVKAKLFFNDSGPEDDYAECYLNINVPNARIEFRGKDRQYRTPLLRALALPWSN